MRCDKRFNALASGGAQTPEHSQAGVAGQARDNPGQPRIADGHTGKAEIWIEKNENTVFVGDAERLKRKKGVFFWV